MIPVHALTLLAAATFFSNHVQAASLDSAPFVSLPGNGLMPLDEKNMVRGTAVDPSAYQPTYSNRTAPTGNGESDVLFDVVTNLENEQIRKMEDYYEIKFVKNADEIMQKWPRGQAKKTPWPGSYWPNYLDGINVRWNGGPSAAEKYARANGLDVQDVMNKVSESSGILSAGGSACRDTNECTPGVEVCAKREGQDSGFCIATWFGLCHAWAPAAILEDEPKCPVTVGDVTFQPNDIKGLITEVYHTAEPEVLFTGLRFDGGDGDAMDEYGRFTDVRHRDVSPAFFHLVCANIMGQTGSSFIVDADAGAQVWNQPARSYEFTEVVTMEPHAASLRFFARSTYPFNNEAKKIQYVKALFKHIQEPAGDYDGELATPERVDTFTTDRVYEYVLELDDSNNIIGSEWIGDSRYNNHPDFIWFMRAGPKAGFVSNAGISYDVVRDLIQRSRATDC